MKLIYQHSIIFIFGLIISIPCPAYAANIESKSYLNEMYEWIKKDAVSNVSSITPAYILNSHSKSISVPTAWGASNNYIFFGGGGSIPAPYMSGPDGAMELGVGVGDSQKTVGTQITLVSLDLSGWKRYALYLHLSKDISDVAALGAGVENVSLTGGSDSDKNFYVVYSQALKSEPFINDNTGQSKFYYTVGAVSNRFGKKSPSDIQSGKGSHGTYLFGSVAYEVAGACNIIAAWNGINLSTGISKTFWINDIPISTILGAADLTSNSGSGVRCTFGFGTGFPF